MERMRVRVESIEVSGQLTLAVVVATSEELLQKLPVAEIRLTVRLPTMLGEGYRGTRIRARDAALAYLDVE
jgi:hypothetical protein